ncbi:Wadjet anti-phage system protein JetD domain-containing protein [Streptosporangium canum]|uniref:Wadjet anti-phage system protein JetD domain-containing protein n=1 Tax=Streptosporangium canum TaxID=324952 RepID=UPI003791B6FB
MKTPDLILQALSKRISANWHLDIVSERGTWPHSFPLGKPTKSELETGFASTLDQTLEWRDWAEKHGLTLVTIPRRVHGTTQSIPTHLTIPDFDTAVGLLGTEWKQRIQRGRNRLAVLKSTFPGTAELPKLVRAVDGYSATDFNLLCTAASWFKNNSASGLTPRQVPIEGLHAKWLNTHKNLVQALAGTDSLGLLPDHPQRIHFTYLDPGHRASRQRWHDSATVGDTMIPAYPPEIVIISENKDTAIHFPPLPKTVSIEGAGFGGAAAIASLEWISTAPHVIYWGDMDSAGFEIVNLFREQGLPVRTVLMDLPTFELYERFGTTTDARGNLLGAPVRKNLIHLSDNELALYNGLTDPAWARVRRVEQERIPLLAAQDAVLRLIRDGLTREIIGSGSLRPPVIP